MKWYEGLVHKEVICVNTLQTNDWLILNSIIYEIYTTVDFDGMRKKFLEQIKMLVDLDPKKLFHGCNHLIQQSNNRRNISTIFKHFFKNIFLTQ